MNTDPITDMLNRIRNAHAVGKAEVVLPFSKLKNEIAMILANNGFLGEVKKTARGKSKMLKLQLKYEQGIQKVEGARRISKPGQRIYVGVDNIKKVRGGFGVAIISTPKGLMTGTEAKKARLGGEVLLEVW